MSDSEKPKCRVVIVGAGPAGLLAAINFLRREGPVQYEVDLVEAGEDYGLLDAAGLEKQRSARVDDSSQHPRPGRPAVTHPLNPNILTANPNTNLNPHLLPGVCLACTKTS